MDNIGKALTFFEGISTRDSALSTRYMDQERYVEHNPRACGGVAGVKQYVDQISADHPELKLVRVIQDGSYVVTQTDGPVLGNGTFFDVFKFESGLIVEHWAFSAEAALPNKSGHTQVDGPTEPNQNEDTVRNKSLVRDYYQAVHVEGRYEVIPQYFSNDYCVRHEPGVADGVAEWKRDLDVLTLDRTIDRISLLVGQNDFVFLVADGTHRGEPCAYIDLYRVENGQVVEHWGFPEQAPPPGMRLNGNGLL